MPQLATIATWYFVTLLIAFAFMPAATWLFRRLPDSGVSFVRPVSLLVLAWPTWMAASVFPRAIAVNTQSLWSTWLVLGFVLFILSRGNRFTESYPLRKFFIFEGVFLVAFLGYVFLRGYGPQITEQEKPSNLMMLSSVMRSDEMPPLDAWLGGERLNYYYFGYVIIAAIAEMSDIVPWKAFNLALALIFGITAVGVAGLVYNIVRYFSDNRLAVTSSFAGVFLILGIGNAQGSMVSATHFRTEWDEFFFEGVGWGATRFIVDRTAEFPNIVEFPAFSFILGDLHPHLISLPFCVLILMVAFTVSISPNEYHQSFARILVLGGIVGGLYTINSWDFPTFAALVFGGLIVGATNRFPYVRVIKSLVLLLGSCILLWLPFHLTFESPTRQSSMFDGLGSRLPFFGSVISSIEFYRGEATSVIEYLGAFGFPLILGVVLALYELFSRWSSSSNASRVLMFTAMISLAILSIVIRTPVVAIVGVGTVWIVFLIAARPQLSLPNLSLGLFGFGMLLTGVVEFIYLGDIFASRMNTIFKIYFQTWLVFGAASALVIPSILQDRERIISVRLALPGASIILSTVLVVGLIYPIVAVKQWLDWRNPDRLWAGVNGLAYLDDPRQPWSSPGEREALHWLWDHSLDKDVVLAQGGCEWGSDIGRVPSVTGVPGILGWDGHELQWHLADSDIRNDLMDRTADLRAMIEDPSTNSDLIDHYGVTLIYIGPVETRGSEYQQAVDGPTCAPGPFEGVARHDYPGPGWEKVFDNGSVKIFRKR